MVVRDLVPGNWYITILCDCGERLILFADLTEGKGSLQGSFKITCPACRTAGTHPAQRYRHESENNDSTRTLGRAC
jgi:hypothetical protein